MGLFPIGITETVKSLGLVVTLFAGPLFESGVADGQWRSWVRLSGLRQCVSGWIGYRNFVAVCSLSLSLLLSHT